MCLSYPLLRMLNKQDMTSQTMEETTMQEKILDENKSNLKRRLTQENVESSVVTTTQSVATIEDMALDVCFIFLYHLTSRKSLESILATTALLFWKVSSFPVNCTASSTDLTKGTKTWRRKSISTSHAFEKGNGFLTTRTPRNQRNSSWRNQKSKSIN